VIGWFGPMFGRFGYAEHNREMCRALIRRGVKVMIAPSMFPEPPLSPAEEELLPYVAGYGHVPDDIIMVHCIPANPLPRRGGYTIALTTVESIAAHPNVVARLRLYDEVWVPSGYCRKSLVRGGLTSKEIEVVPEGVDGGEWFVSRRSPAVREGECLELMYHGDWSTRKGVHELVFACAAVAERVGGIRLTLWVNVGRDRGDEARAIVWKEVEDMKRAAGGGRGLDVVVDLAEKTVAEVRGRYHGSHYFVHLGRGEGWNLTVSQAAACGCPLIALAACGEKEFLPKGLFTKVRTRGRMQLEEMGDVRVGHHQGMEFWRVDMASVERVLLGARREHPRARERARRLAAYMRDRVTWDVAAAIAERRLDWLCRKLGLPLPREGNWPERERRRTSGRESVGGARRGAAAARDRSGGNGQGVSALPGVGGCPRVTGV